MLRSALVLATSVLMFAAPAHAGPLGQGRFAGSLSVGSETSIEGDVHRGATAPVASLAALNPNLPAVSAELRIGSRSYDDIYEQATFFEVAGAYGLGSAREVFGALRSTSADEGSVQVGTAFVPALSAELPVFGTFDEYSAFGAEIGVRQYFSEGVFSPYVAGRLGILMVDEINATFSVPVPAGVGAEPNDINLVDVPFYGETTTWTVGADVGGSYDFNDAFSVFGEVGVRYQGELEGDDAAIGGLGLGSINDDGSRWSVPVSIGARFAF